MPCCTDKASGIILALLGAALLAQAQDERPMLDAGPPREHVDMSELDPRVRAAAEILDKLDDGKPATTEDWIVVCEACGLNPAVTRIALRVKPFPRETLVALLTHAKFAVRSGALELLEDKSGEDFGFDPWNPGGDASQVALTRWQSWLKPGETAKPVEQAKDAPLDDAKLRGYFVDIAGPDLAKHERAVDALSRQGMQAVAALEQYMHDTPQLPEGVRAKLKEAQYRLVIQDVQPKDAARMARDLVFGGRDAKLAALTWLPRIREKAVPVIAEFLPDPDALLREAAMDALLLAGEEPVYDMVEERLKAETDENVIHAVLRRVSPKTSGGTKLITSFVTAENEDLAVAALNALSDGGASEGADKLPQCLADKRWRVRVAALEYAGKIRSKSAAKEILAAFSDKDEFVRYAAMKAAADIKLEEAVPRITKMALADDSVLGPAVEAIVRMGRKIPDELVTALPSKPGDVLLVVLRAFEEHAGHDGEHVDFSAIRESGSSRGDEEKRAAALQALKLVRSLAQHSDEDVRIAAFHVLGRNLQDAGDKKLVYDALQSAQKDETRISILQSIWPGGFDFRESLLPEPDDEKTVVADATDIFARVLAEPPPRNPDLEGAYAAFGVKLGIPAAPGVKTVDPSGRVWQPMDKEFNDLLTAGMESQNADLAFLCAMHLTLGGQRKAAPALLRMLPRMEPHQRVHVAELLKESQHITRSRAGVPLLRTLLQDESPEARQDTVYALMNLDKPSGLRLLLEEVAKPESRLLPSEAYNYQTADVVAKASNRAQVFVWIDAVLKDASATTGVKTLALALLGTMTGADAKALIEAHLHDPEVWPRRAAWRSLWRVSRPAFTEDVATLAADPSPRVREVLAAGFLKKERAEFEVWFGEREMEEEHVPYSRERGNFTLPDEVEPLLRKLAEDADPMLRFRAMTALLSWKKSVTPLALREAVVALDEDDRKKMLYSLLSNNGWQQLDARFGFLLDQVERKWFGSDWEQIVKRLRPEEKKSTKMLSQFASLVREDAPAASGDKRQDPPTPDNATIGLTATNAEVVFFYKPGCKDCERTRDMLISLGRAVSLKILESNIETSEGAQWNETLCRRFDVASSLHQISPAVFTHAGALIKTEITMGALQRLMDQTLAAPTKPGWREVDEAEMKNAGAQIESRYAAFSAGIVFAAGLLDGINPCAFATIIFFLSYLHIARRRPHEILMVGGAFILAVFLTYFAVGLGLSHVIAKVQAFSWVRVWLNRVLAFVALLLAWLSLRDGIRAVRGQLGDMTLQLPEFLKTRIRGVIREQSRARRFIIAAFVSGIIISLLELACTGQVYLPTIVYMMRQGSTSAVFWLLVYNVAFVLPLAAIFFLVYFGMKSDALIAWQKRHTALVRFATCALFLALWLVLMLA